MSKPKSKLTELQFKILNGMADDYENVEQLYLCANRQFGEERRVKVEFPLMLFRVDFPLHEMIDEIAYMFREGYIEAKYTNDENFAPLKPLDFATLHHYWFGATEKGTQAWKTYSTNKPPNSKVE